MEIIVNERLCLSEFRPADKPALVERLNDRGIYDLTLRIPYPYSAAHADEWLALAARSKGQQGRPVNWAIRDKSDHLIGGIGLDGLQIGVSHRAEVGYWLGRPFWGQGMMTAVVGRVCQLAFEELGLIKVVAHVFAGNPASARVLQKCGFEQEGYLKKHHHKDGRFVDSRLFGLLK